MVNLMRKYQQTLMLLVTVLIIICFVWLYNDTRFDRLSDDRAGSIYGRTVTVAEYLRARRKFEVSRQLMMVELLETLVSGARSMDDAVENFVWNTMVLRHEADRLGIVPTDDEVIAAVQQLPAFQTRNVYDSSKYNAFVEKVLTPNGFTPGQLEEIVQDDLRLRKIKTLLGSAVDAAPGEVRAAYDFRHRKTELSVVRLKLEDFAKGVQVSDEDVKKLYEERKETLKSDELRKVRYVAFTVPPAEKPLAGKERVEVMQKLADRASEFTVAMTEKGADFGELAKRFNVEAKATTEFSLSSPPADLEKSQEIARTVFTTLTQEQPNSDVVMTPTGYYVLQLTGVTASHPLTFEEAKSKLAEQLKDERAQEGMNLQAAEVRKKLEAELKAGKTFADAATAAGVSAEKLPPFSLAEPGKMEAPDAQMLMGRSLQMAEGELSEAIPTAGGIALIHVEKRHPVDEEKFKQEKTVIAEQVAGGKTEAVFGEWLRDRRRAANVITARG